VALFQGQLSPPPAVLDLVHAFRNNFLIAEIVGVLGDDGDGLGLLKSLEGHRRYGTPLPL
jgi:hypothetical protein